MEKYSSHSGGSEALRFQKVVEVLLLVSYMAEIDRFLDIIVFKGYVGTTENGTVDDQPWS